MRIAGFPWKKFSIALFMGVNRVGFQGSAWAATSVKVEQYRLFRRHGKPANDTLFMSREIASIKKRQCP